MIPGSDDALYCYGSGQVYWSVVMLLLSAVQLYHLLTSLSTVICRLYRADIMPCFIMVRTGRGEQLSHTFKFSGKIFPNRLSAPAVNCQYWVLVVS